MASRTGNNHDMRGPKPRPATAVALAREAVQPLREIHNSLKPKDVCPGDGRREFEALLKKGVEEEMAMMTGVSAPALGVPDPDLMPRYRAASKASSVAREQERELEKELQRLYTDLLTLRAHGRVIRHTTRRGEYLHRVRFRSAMETRLCRGINQTTEALAQAARVRKAAGHYADKLEAELPEAERRGLAIERRYM